MDNGDQQLVLSDSKYRYYSTSMEKALKSFENTREWADLISALAKVNKLVGSHKSYNVLPKKVTIGKRLAQCLHPALPAGVHIKALELYETIFTNIGPSFVAKDFPIYSAGLLPLLGHAAMTVKPVLLKLYETFVLPVSGSIKPAAAGVILGVLPGLEEGSDYHDRTNKLLEQFVEAFGAEHFYSSFWSCLFSNSTVRLAGTSFLLSHIDKTRSMEDQLYLLGTDLRLLVSALKACLEDSAVLVERNALDILSVAFPFHNSQLTKEDQSDVISSAILVLLRRDMSLNRRFFAWLLGVSPAGTSVVKRAASSSEMARQRHDSGSSSASEPELEYFSTHTKKLLVQSLHSHLNSVSEQSVDVIKPLRVVTSLLDRADIGSAVLEDILVGVFRLLRRFHSSHIEKPFVVNPQMSTYQLANMLSIDLHAISSHLTSSTELPPKQHQELLKTCNLLFGTLEPPFLWHFLSDTYERVLWPSEVRPGTDLDMSEFCDMVNMLLSIMSLEIYVETQTVHLPRMLYNLLNMLAENMADTSLQDVTQVLLLCRRLVAVIAPADVSSAEDDVSEVVRLHDSIPFVQDILCQRILVADSENQKVTDSADRRHSLLSCCLLLIEMSSFPVYHRDGALPKPVAGDTKIPGWIESLISNACGSHITDIQSQFICASVLIDLIRLSYLSLETSQRSPLHRYSSVESEGGTAVVLVNIQPLISPALIDSIKTKQQQVFVHLWSNMRVEQLVHCTESSFVLSNLLSIHAEGQRSGGGVSRLQTIIIRDLTSKDNARRLLAYKKFSLLWHQTRSFISGSNHMENILMVVLSSLMYETDLIQEVIREWLVHAVQCDDISRILKPFISMLLESDTSRTSVQQKGDLVNGVSEEVQMEMKMQQRLDAVQSRITSIASDGRVLMSKSPTTQKDVKVARQQSLISKQGKISSTQAAHEAPAYDKLAGFSRAGLALNPFGTVSELDQLIFDGFIPHQTLSSRWAAATNKKEREDDYQSVMARAKRLDKETCKKEGILFGEEAIDNTPQQVDVDKPQQVDVDTLQQVAVDTAQQVEVATPQQVDVDTPQQVEVGTPQQVEVDSNSIEKAAANAATSNKVIPLPNTSQLISRKAEPPPLPDVDSETEAEEVTTQGEMATQGQDVTNGTTELCDMDRQVPDTCSASVVSSVTNTDSVFSSDSSAIDKQEDAELDDKFARKHGFVLLYDQCYDTERVLFALSVIQRVVAVSPSLVLSNLTTTSCSDHQLLQLLARQRRSLEGDNYYTELSQEEIISLRNTRLLEVLVTVCLYFWRSYLPLEHNADACVIHNSPVQLRAVDLLLTLLSDVTLILSDCPKGFPQYMVDVMTRCKLVKTCVFHVQCLLQRRQLSLAAVGASHDSTVDSLMFRKCLQLVECIISLESKLQLVHEHQNSSVKGGGPALFKRMLFSHPSLLATMSSHLSQVTHSSVHHPWLSLITNCLPLVLSQPVTADVVQEVIVRVCEIFDRLGKETLAPDRRQYPPDYVHQLLEDFTVICHFCFMDVSSALIGQTEDSKPTGISTGQILSNLVSVFNPLGSAIRGRLGSNDQETSAVTDGDPRRKCRDRLLSMMPKILASLSSLWSCSQAKDDQKAVRLVVGFFSPILHNYTEQLLGSVAVVWSDSQDGALDACAHQTQKTLVELLLSIKALPMDTIVDKLGLVMKRPPSTNHQTNPRVQLQLSCLKFLKGYIVKTHYIARTSLSSVCSLLKHCLQLGLPPPGILLLLETVTEFVYKLGVIDDRKVIKDLQEIVGKVLDAFCQIISLQLEATSWTIRKNYTVKVRAQPAEANDLYPTPPEQMSIPTPGISVEDNISTEEHESEYAYLALSLLAEVTAGLLDVVYPSEDKDKVASLLTNVLSRVFPYLRNHSLLNMSCFQASSKLLASISSYQYTRRTWRRDAYDILLSPDFFRMDVQSLTFWKVLADNLVTHEKAMFKDLLGKFAITANAIALFSTKDFEHLQRVHNLKKLSFIIYSGDVDHYKHYMPDIQERLAENLRLTQVPAVLSQGFLCFRVLLLRMSAGALTSLWPTIITELVSVMAQIEEDLALSDEEEQQMSRVNEIDSFSSLKEVNLHHSPCWLELYLSACKLLDLLLFLPADIIPEFQSYAWMFVGSDDTPITNGHPSEKSLTGFSSHVPKIAQMMTWKFGEYSCPSHRQSLLLLQEQTISSLKDLQPFFARLMVSVGHSQDHFSSREQAERVIDNDFVEPVT